jgi:hypothetical protein
VNILEATREPRLFAPWFRDRATWNAWFAFLSALFALPMTAAQLAIYQQCTNRTEPPTRPATEGWLICGRRAGKSFVLALCAVFLACFKRYREQLQPGERATILIIAADRAQARVIFRYVRGLLTGVPMLAAMIERETTDSFDLDNGTTIEIATVSYRTTRGYTLAAVLCDELAFWRTDDSSEPDYEVLNALRPGTVTVKGSLILCASSPSRRGSLWDTRVKHYGKDHDPVLVWQSDTRTMNNTVPQSVIDEAFERDPVSAFAEWGGQFRTDIETFVGREIVEACIETGCFERPPVSGISYVGFIDPSGGSSDSMTLAVAHRVREGEHECGVVDAVRERRPPFSPDAVVEEFATVLKSYGIAKVHGDRYAGEWPRERFHLRGITYEPSAKTKSQIYGELLPLLNSKRVDLLDHARLSAQLVGLERRTTRGGRESIDHAPGARDDIANAVAGALTLCVGALTGGQRLQRMLDALPWDNPRQRMPQWMIDPYAPFWG